MNKDFFNIITQLLRELELNAGMFSIVDGDTTILQSREFILVRNNKVGDYFLLAEIKTSELDFVNRDLQTSLMSSLNSLLSNTDGHVLQPLSGVSTLKINNHFEKNTTLLLFTRKIGDVDKQLTKITEVEEDEYFFKKQVVLLPANFLSILANKLTESRDFKIITYLQDCMNDTGKFNKFIKNPNADTNYAGCAQLFEKLPFLHLNTPSSESNFLQNDIDKGIVENIKKYSITNNQEEEDGSSSKIIVKNLNDITSAALKYVSEAEESDGDLDVEAMLINLQGNGLYE